MDPVVHFEIPVDNIKKTQTFYQKLFGWKFKHYKEHDYYGIIAKRKGQDGINGGMMARKMKEQTAVNYVHVKSVDIALKKAKSLGAKVHLPKTPIGNMGAIAIIGDPEGNCIGLHEMGRKIR